MAAPNQNPSVIPAMMRSNPDATAPITKEAHANLLSQRIIDEIVYAFGGKRNGVLQRIATPIIRSPARHFGKIAADFYDDVINLGVSRGALAALPRFNHSVISRGNETIPKDGGLLLVSNHPGGLDSLGIISRIPRNDLRILVTDVEFMHLLDIRKRFFYYVSFETLGGMVALRGAIDHLKSGGALLLYAHGEVDPEPECFPSAMDEVMNWSSSIEIMLRKAQQTKLQIITVSGAVHPRYINNPITRIRRESARRQKLAEFIQVIRSMMKPSSNPIQMKISFGSPIETGIFTGRHWMPEVKQIAQEHLARHLQWVKTLPPTG